MKPSRNAGVATCLLVLAFLFETGCNKNEPVDEAKAGGKTTADFAADEYDYFRDMDMRPDGTVDANGNSRLKPLELTPDEIKGRNTWVLWSAGDEVFWDYLAGHSYGFMDLLKLCDFAPDDKVGGKRWGPVGLTIEPGTKVPGRPDQFGLYIRQPEDTTSTRVAAAKGASDARRTTRSRTPPHTVPRACASPARPTGAPRK